MIASQIKSEVTVMQETYTYLTTAELAERIKYEPRYIREFMMDSVLLEGIHYVRPFGGRKILFLWEAVERDMLKSAQTSPMFIPMTSGGVCNG